MNDDRLIELADSYVDAVLRSEYRADVQGMLRLIVLRAAFMEVHEIACAKSGNKNITQHPPTGETQ